MLTISWTFVLEKWLCLTSKWHRLLYGSLSSSVERSQDEHCKKVSECVNLYPTHYTHIFLMCGLFSTGKLKMTMKKSFNSRTRVECRIVSEARFYSCCLVTESCLWENTQVQFAKEISRWQTLSDKINWGSSRHYDIHGGPKSKPLVMIKIVLNRIKACQWD